MLPLHWSIPVAELFICLIGINNAYTRKYALASAAISLLPPKNPGRGPLISTATLIRMTEYINAMIRPCFAMLLASFSLPAPTLWAICTLYPTAAAIISPPNIQVLLDTSPIDADALEFKCPTIDASIYSIIIDESWAKIAGKLKFKIIQICSPRLILTPVLNFSK